MRLSLIIIPIFSFILVSCAPTTQTPSISNDVAAKEAALQRELAVKENMAMERRLNNVAAPILMSNAALCDEMVAAYIGANFVTKDAVSKEYRETYASLYGVDVQPTVTLVAKKSPASGKLKVGDMVTYVNGEALPEGKRSLQKLQKLIADNESASPMVFTIDRKGKAVDVKVSPVHACDSQIVLLSDDIVNAFADGERIAVTKGMMRFAQNDTELATIVGHELAHNSREHIGSKQGNAIIGGILGAVVTVATGVDVTDLGTQIGAGAFSQSFEAEADYVGLYHTARAGYNINGAPNLWRRMAANNASGIHLAGSTHPSTAKRYLALEETVKEIKAKKASGKKLIPEEREIQEPVEEKTKDGLNG